MATPQVLSRRANGLGPGEASGHAPKPIKAKALAEGEKVVIRRLPPGMTEDECVNILGDDWKVGNGRVDWFSYVLGKISKE
jgi:regulator of nonsense transcripts 3